MTREEAILYVSFQMDDAHYRRHARPADVSPDHRLVGFRQDLEIVFVAVRSHRPGVTLSDEAVKDLARPEFRDSVAMRAASENNQRGSGEDSA